MRLTLSRFSKYFQRYVEHEMYKDRVRTRHHPLIGTKIAGVKPLYFGKARPWTDQFHQENVSGKNQPKVFVEPIKEQKIFLGDRVQLLVGKDAGKQGLINAIIKERNWCFVDGLNNTYTAVGTSNHMPPTCFREEEPLLVTTQVALVDPSDQQPTDIEWRYTERGTKARVSVRTGRIIPLPHKAIQPEDIILVPGYIEGDKCTKEKLLTKVTFDPKLKSFEEDIMDSLGIKEDRNPGKTYWY